MGNIKVKFITKYGGGVIQSAVEESFKIKYYNEYKLKIAYRVEDYGDGDEGCIALCNYKWNN